MHQLRPGAGSHVMNLTSLFGRSFSSITFASVNVLMSRPFVSLAMP